jgi:hypothetical protein
LYDSSANKTRIVGDRKQGTAHVRGRGQKEVKENCILLLFSKHYWAWHVASIGDKFVQNLVKKPDGTVPFAI